MTKYFRRSLYMLYYLKGINFRQFSFYLKYAAAVSGKSKAEILRDIVSSVYKHNISFKDYFYFRFYELSDEDRHKWAGTGFMYEYQLIMNPRESRDILANKIKFLNYFKNFIKRGYSTLSAMKNDPDMAKKMLDNPSGRIVLKNSLGQVGAEVEVVPCSGLTPSDLIKLMRRKKYDLAEEYVLQHPSLMSLSPSGLNTVRIFTQLDEEKVCFLGARLRISVNSHVDNLAAGNLAAPVDLESGVVTGPGVYSDISKSDQEFHPLTGEKIPGFTIPFWKDVLDTVEKAASLMPQNRSVGWDIAVTDTGPELIEGNHNWCKLLWQLPVKQGLKNALLKYL